MANLPEKLIITLFGLTLLTGVYIKTISFKQQTNVLGARTQVADLQLKEQQYWQKVIQQHPDYRDGYLKLALLAQARGDLSQTKQFLAQALRLDPNYPLPPALQPLVQ